MHMHMRAGHIMITLCWPCRYFLAPKSEIIAALTDKQLSHSSQIDNLKASKAALEKGLRGVEGELRELLQQSPALARQISAQAE